MEGVGEMIIRNNKQEATYLLDTSYVKLYPIKE